MFNCTEHRAASLRQLSFSYERELRMWSYARGLCHRKQLAVFEQCAFITGQISMIDEEVVEVDAVRVFPQQSQCLAESAPRVLVTAGCHLFFSSRCSRLKGLELCFVYQRLQTHVYCMHKQEYHLLSWVCDHNYVNLRFSNLAAVQGRYHSNTHLSDFFWVHGTLSILR